MKKIINLSIMYLVVSLITLCSNAQQSSSGFNENGLRGDGVAAKSYQINSRAIRDFTKSFKNASAVQWFNTAEGAMVYFTSDGIKTRSDYDKNGNWRCNLRTYQENILPRDIRARVKPVYYDYTITLVDEITTASSVTYIIHLEDKSTIKWIKVCEGEDMEEIKTLDKN